MSTKANFTVERHENRAVYRLAWPEVERILGHAHANTVRDDAVLWRALRAAGARPLAKSYSAHDGWHAYAPKGTKVETVTRKSNPRPKAKRSSSGLDEARAEGELLASMHAAEFSTVVPQRRGLADKLEGAFALGDVLEADAGKRAALAGRKRKREPEVAAFWEGYASGISATHAPLLTLWADLHKMPKVEKPSLLEKAKGAAKSAAAKVRAAVGRKSNPGPARTALAKRARSATKLAMPHAPSPVKGPKKCRKCGKVHTKKEHARHRNVKAKFASSEKIAKRKVGAR